VLSDASVEVNLLPKEEAQVFLKSDQCTAEVNELLKLNRLVNGVPFFRFPGNKTLSGAQTMERFVAILEVSKKAKFPHFVLLYCGYHSCVCC